VASARGPAGLLVVNPGGPERLASPDTCSLPIEPLTRQVERQLDATP